MGTCMNALEFMPLGITASVARLNFNLRSKIGLAGTPSGCVNIMQATHRGYLPQHIPLIAPSSISVDNEIKIKQ